VRSIGRGRLLLMGAGHGHGGSSSAGANHRWRLAVAFVLVALFFVVELVFGLLANSLALISDAGHMAADVVALGAALVATKIAGRPDKTGRRSYGSYRAEVFASGLAVLIMVGVSGYVVVEALTRLGSEPEPQTGTMLVVGSIGLVINVISILMLRGGSTESLNVKGAYYEVVADAAGSVGVIVAGILVAVTGHGLWDTVVAVAIGMFVGVRAVSLGRQVLAVLGQHAPEGMVLDVVIADLEAVEGVREVHDFHAWTLTSGMNVATAHLVVEATADPQVVLESSRQLLSSVYGMEHATLQVEARATATCHEVQW
jgi:cobalt-zinc-cadmium efflux system protein